LGISPHLTHFLLNFSCADLIISLQALYKFAKASAG